MPSSEPPPDPRPPLVSFSCMLCGSRLTARVSDVGRNVKCPDCERIQRIPPPPRPPKSRVPPALQEESYEVWGVDEAPLPADLAARQPRFIGVDCRLCGTLMYATEDQIGAELTCPDCGVQTRVRDTPMAKRTAPQPVADGDEYELDPESAPTPRPTPQIPALIEAQRHAAAQVVHHDPRQGGGAASLRRPPAEKVAASPRSVGAAPDAPGAPDRRRFMLLTGDVAGRWLGLSAWLIAVAWLLREGWMTSGGGMAAISQVCFFACGIMLAAPWWLAASALWLAIVTETASNHDQLYAPPSGNFFDWMGEAVYAALAVAAGTVPAWLGWRLLAAEPAVQLPAAVAIGLAGIGFALLSALDEGSPLGVISGRLAASLIRRPLPWLLFGTAAAALAAGTTAVGPWMLERWGVLTAPVAFAASLVYARSVGKLGRRLSAATSGDDVDQADEDDAPAGPGASYSAGSK